MVLKKNVCICAETQHKLSADCVKAEPVEKAVLTEDERNIYASGKGFSYVFDKHYGTFVSMVVNGKEQLADKVSLSAMRAPTDNDRNIKQFWLKIDIWQGENLDYTFAKVYDCKVEDGVIVTEASVAGVSRYPFIRYTQTVEIFADGQIKYSVDGNIRKDAFWLPRLGFEFTLPKTSDEFTYYGRGPLENYGDMHHMAPVGMYSSSAEKEYVNYVYPQEHGNHTEVKMLQIGDLEFGSENGFECNVSEYTAADLYKAMHTDELKKDGNIHLRIDYKVSGIGSNSCGPVLSEQYRLSEKEIYFSFSVKPKYN